MLIFKWCDVLVNELLVIHLKVNLKATDLIIRLFGGISRSFSFFSVIDLRLIRLIRHSCMTCFCAFFIALVRVIIRGHTTLLLLVTLHWLAMNYTVVFDGT